MGQNPLGHGLYSQPRTTNETVARRDGLPHGFMGHRVGAHPQMVGAPTPAPPAPHPGGALSAAAIQLVAPCQPAAPALTARAPAVAVPAPPWRLLGYPVGRCCPRRGPPHRRDARQGG